MCVGTVGRWPEAGTEMSPGCQASMLIRGQVDYFHTGAIEEAGKMDWLSLPQGGSSGKCVQAGCTQDAR